MIALKELSAQMEQTMLEYLQKSGAAMEEATKLKRMMPNYLTKSIRTQRVIKAIFLIKLESLN